MTTGVFTLGGAVQEKSVYIKRAADAELLELCRASRYGYVLAPRQIGKTSLMYRTKKQLIDEGIRCVTIILSATLVTAEEWYKGLVVDIADQLEFPQHFASQWWNEQTHLGVSQRFKAFMQRVVLREVSRRIVIIIDEIDVTLSLPFADDFFAIVRTFYDERGVYAPFNRLSFVFIGVATPTDLIHDATRSPFNIGEAVPMTDFTPQEAEPLLKGFAAEPAIAQQHMAMVFEWTGGHPYLTQRLCSELRDYSDLLTPEQVEAHVQQTFLSKDTPNSNLEEVERILTKRPADPHAQRKPGTDTPANAAPPASPMLSFYGAIMGRQRLLDDPQSPVNAFPVLSLYRTIVRGRRALDDPQSPVKRLLKLSGIVRVAQSRLVVRNRIYKTAFNERWVRERLEQMPNYWRQQLTRQIRRVAIILLLALIPLSIALIWQLFEANSERARAVSEKEEAEKSRNIAESVVLAYHAQVITDTEQKMEILLAAKDKWPSQQIDQAMRQEIEKNACVPAGGVIYGIAWPNENSAYMSRAPVQGLSHANFVKIDQKYFGVSLSPDGTIALVNDTKDGVYFWKTDGTTKPSLTNIQPPITQTAWSADSKQLAIIHNEEVDIWNAPSATKMHTLKGDTEATSVAWSGDGKLIAVGDAYGMVLLYNAVTGARLEQSLPLGSDAVQALALNPNGTRLVAGIGNVMYTQTVASGTLITSTLENDLRTISWSPDGSRFLTADADKTVIVWDDKDQPLRESVLTKEESASMLAWKPDGTNFITASEKKICVHKTFDVMVKEVDEDYDPAPDAVVNQILNQSLPPQADDTPSPTLEETDVSPLPTTPVPTTTTPEYTATPPYPSPEPTTAIPTEPTTPAIAVPTTDATTGATAGATTGATEGATVGATTGATEGATEGATAGATTGATEGATEGATAGATTGATTGATEGATVGATTGPTTPGATTGATTGSTTAVTAGTTTGATTNATIGRATIRQDIPAATSEAGTPEAATLTLPKAPSESTPATPTLQGT